MQEIADELASQRSLWVELTHTSAPSTSFGQTAPALQKASASHSEARDVDVGLTKPVRHDGGERPGAVLRNEFFHAIRIHGVEPDAGRLGSAKFAVIEDPEHGGRRLFLRNAAERVIDRLVR